MSGTNITEILAKHAGVEIPEGMLCATRYPATPLSAEASRGGAVEVVGGAEDLLIGLTGGQLRIGYLTRQKEPLFFFSDGPGRGDLRIFSTQADRDDFIERCRNERILCVIVDRHDGDKMHYSVAGSVNYPNRAWDVTPCGVYLPDAEMKRTFLSDVAKDGKSIARSRLVASINEVLDRYSDCENGDVFGQVIEAWSIGEGSLPRRLGCDANWGVIGRDVAVEGLQIRVARPLFRLETGLLESAINGSEGHVDAASPGMGGLTLP